MAYTHEDLQLVAKHVAQAEKNLQQQRSIVTELKASDYPTNEAVVTLGSLEAMLLTLRERHQRILSEVAELSESVD